MSKIKNIVLLCNGYIEVTVEHRDKYSHKVLLDSEDLCKVGKMRISNTGYAYTCNGSKSVSHVVMNHESNFKTVVDHINGNKLDNRKINLRVVDQLTNNHNKHSFIRNNTGSIGVSYRKRGNYEYYRVSLSDRTIPVGNRQGQRYTKQFNINKLGKEKAFLLANEWLKEMKISLGYKS
jgi:AP2 domain